MISFILYDTLIFFLSAKLAYNNIIMLKYTTQNAPELLSLELIFFLFPGGHAPDPPSLDVLKHTLLVPL